MIEIPADVLESGWCVGDDRKGLERRFEFSDFRAAMGWMVRAAFLADAMDHHPEWTNVYNRIDVRLTSHDAGGLTDRDVKLARALNEIA